MKIGSSVFLIFLLPTICLISLGFSLSQNIHATEDMKKLQVELASLQTDIENERRDKAALIQHNQELEVQLEMQKDMLNNERIDKEKAQEDARILKGIAIEQMQRLDAERRAKEEAIAELQRLREGNSTQRSMFENGGPPVVMAASVGFITMVLTASIGIYMMVKGRNRKVLPQFSKASVKEPTYNHFNPSKNSEVMIRMTRWQAERYIQWTRKEGKNEPV